MINLLVADDHRVLREGLCELLHSKGKYQIVGQASDGEEVITLLKNITPDLIIMDISMPKLTGIETITKLLSLGNKLPVLILSANENETNVRAALKAGAKGFVSKNADADELEFAIESIIRGQTYLSPSVTTQLMSGVNEDGTLNDPLKCLTSREREIMGLLANGKTNREISKQLFISIRTVDTHRGNILKKLNLNTNSELTKLAVATGLITV